MELLLSYKSYLEIKSFQKLSFWVFKDFMNIWIICHINYTKEDHSLMGIYNCMDINKRQKVFSFTDPNMRGMIAINSEVSHKTHMFDVSIEGDIIRNCFIETMVRDIDQYLRYKIDFFDERKDMT